jgi:hypothetical protein
MEQTLGRSGVAVSDFSLCEVLLPGFAYWCRERRRADARPYRRIGEALFRFVNGSRPQRRHATKGLETKPVGKQTTCQRHPRARMLMLTYICRDNRELTSYTFEHVQQTYLDWPVSTGRNSMRLTQEAVDQLVTEPFAAGRAVPRLLFDFAVMMAATKPSILDAPILDFGAGTGWISEFCARMGFKSVSFDCVFRLSVTSDSGLS